VFYEALGGKTSAIARSIHTKGANGRPDPAPYTIGPLFAEGHLNGVRITTLQDCTQSSFNLAEVTSKAWEKLQGTVIRIGSANMKVLGIKVASEDTYERIWEDAAPKHGLQLNFEMPARFSQFGRDHVLPIPRNLWQFYLLRWNRYSGLAGRVPPEFLTWVEHQVHVMELTLETRLAYIEGNSTVSGVMGTVTYQAFREKEPPPPGKENIVPESQLPRYLRAWQALASFATYCGTGENAMIGMGRTHKLSAFGDYQSPE
jgi:CRISPR-associated endoribonuclease Cas6